jgi:hypothetical protein
MQRSFLLLSGCLSLPRRFPVFRMVEGLSPLYLKPHLESLHSGILRT